MCDDHFIVYTSSTWSAPETLDIVLDWEEKSAMHVYNLDLHMLLYYL